MIHKGGGHRDHQGGEEDKSYRLGESIKFAPNRCAFASVGISWRSKQLRFVRVPVKIACFSGFRIQQ
ncbi:hypothetical protein SUGI_0606240 [Cryptomeria japonica]|nr:hypothetical protein SUGI_0606240 [Cryptomeria japonica]